MEERPKIEFTLDELKVISNEKEFILTMIDLFIKNISQSLQRLKRQKYNPTLNGIRDIVHKAIPTFGNFRAHGMVKQLKDFETMIVENPKSPEETWNEVSVLIPQWQTYIEHAREKYEWVQKNGIEEAD